MRHFRMTGLGWIAITLFIATWTMTAAAQTVVTPAKAVGPLHTDKEDYPFLQANRVQAVVDLPKFGYVEEEFIVSGNANVYEWASDGSVKVKTLNAPYTSRILVRRPASAAKFSGNVILEPLENNRSFDWAFLWAASYEYFIEHGDAWVGITHNPQAVESLKKFNAKRYASLSMANPSPNDACGPGQAKSETEVGLKFDMFSQVGALLKSPAGPMSGFQVQNIYPTSHTGEIVTYMNAIHSKAKLASGKPVFDGYVIKGDQGPTPISRCNTAPPPNDPRRLTKNVGVPVIRVVAEGDVIAGYPLRLADSDQPGDQFRLYEVAAAPHMDIRYYQHMPATEDQSKSGATAFPGVWPFAYQCDRQIGGLLDLPVFQVTLNAAFSHLDQWVRTGTAPLHAERMTVKDAGTPQASIATDQYGNGMGGIRSAYVDVPAATYVTHTPGPAICRNLGYKVSFDWARLEALYGSSKSYAAKVNEVVDRLVKDRWLLESDAKRVKKDLLGGGTGNNN